MTSVMPLIFRLANLVISYVGFIDDDNATEFVDNDATISFTDDAGTIG